MTLVSSRPAWKARRSAGTTCGAWSEPPSPADDPAAEWSSRPTWRGRIHLIALWTVLPLLVALAIEARHARSRGAVIVYAVGLCLMLTASTVYHRWARSPRARTVLRRADHAAIFFAIAGTFTAIALISLSTGPAIAMLILIWLAALAGAVVKFVAFERANRLGAVMYIGMGWTGLLLVPALLDHSGWPTVILLLGGGVLYTVGAAGFARQWPTLRPATFSYHEVWHLYTIGAAGLHFAAVWVVAT